MFTDIGSYLFRKQLSRRAVGVISPISKALNLRAPIQDVSAALFRVTVRYVSSVDVVNSATRDTFSFGFNRCAPIVLPQKYLHNFIKYNLLSMFQDNY